MPIPLLNSSVCFAAVIGALVCAPAHADCNPGVYGRGDGDFVVVVSLPERLPPPAQRYLFLDGRRGSTADPGSPVTCADGVAMVKGDDGRSARWPAIAMNETDTSFSSVQTRLVGRLIEPARPSNRRRPLVVMVHGSGPTISVGRDPYAYVLAAQDMAVFVYDKRGIGASEGYFTQNFDLLAADAAAALTHARTMGRERFGRARFFGASMAGFVAPLAATRSAADFVAIGYGLVVTPLEEDREEMLSEARALGLGPDAVALINRLSAATSRLLLSGFAEGHEQLAEVRRELASKPWAAKLMASTAATCCARAMKSCGGSAASASTTSS